MPIGRGGRISAGSTWGLNLGRDHLWAKKSQYTKGGKGSKEKKGRWEEESSSYERRGIKDRIQKAQRGAMVLHRPWKKVDEGRRGRRSQKVLMGHLVPNQRIRRKREPGKKKKATKGRKT